MNEQKVREAVKVANELVDWKMMPEHSFVHIWRDVFGALLMEPLMNNLTATGVTATQDEQPVK